MTDTACTKNFLKWKGRFDLFFNRSWVLQLAHQSQILLHSLKPPLHPITRSLFLSVHMCMCFCVSLLFSCNQHSFWHLWTSCLLVPLAIPLDDPSQCLSEHSIPNLVGPLSFLFHCPTTPCHRPTPITPVSFTALSESPSSSFHCWVPIVLFLFLFCSTLFT